MLLSPTIKYNCPCKLNENIDINIPNIKISEPKNNTRVVSIFKNKDKNKSKNKSLF